MAQLNDFMTRIDLSVLNGYVAANGKSVVYARGERIVQQGQLCRYVGMVKSGYFKYVALNSKGQEVVPRRQLHRVREAESSSDASESEDI